MLLTGHAQTLGAFGLTFWATIAFSSYLLHLRPRRTDHHIYWDAGSGLQKQRLNLVVRKAVACSDGNILSGVLTDLHFVHFLTMVVD